MNRDRCTINASSAFVTPSVTHPSTERLQEPVDNQISSKWAKVRSARMVHSVLYRASGYKTTSGWKKAKPEWATFGEPVDLRVGRHAIQARYIPGDPERQYSGQVLFFHGGSENLFDVTRIEKCQQLQRQGYSILAYNPLGYGQSEGKRSPQGDCAVAKALVEHLTHDRTVQPEQITLIGSSIGSGVATWIASEYPVKHLVLEAPFAQLENVLPRNTYNRRLGTLLKPLTSYWTTEIIQTHFHYDNLTWIENTQAQSVSIIEGKSDATMFLGWESEGNQLFNASGCEDTLLVRIESDKKDRRNGTHGDRQLYDPVSIAAHIKALETFRQDTTGGKETLEVIGNLEHLQVNKA